MQYRDIRPYNPSLGVPGRRCVSTYSPDSSRDLPKSYDQAAQAYTRAMQRRGGAQGKLSYNTWIETVLIPGQHLGRDKALAIVLHRTRILTFFPDGTIALDSGGWQTPTTRDRMNRCGISIGMGDGIPTVRHKGHSYPYVDGMILKPNGGVTYPADSKPIGSVEAIRSRRRRLLAKVRRVERKGERFSGPVDPWYWDSRQGGQAWRGTAPEVFRTDSECGLKGA